MKRSVVIVLSLLAFVLAAPLLAAAAEFKLVIPLPLTGKTAKFGEIMKKSYEMAAEEINAAGGIKGSTLALGFEDSTGKPEIARSIVEKLIESKQPVIVGEYTSACAKAVAAVAEERKTPYLVVASADDAITQQNYQYVFRQNPVNAHYADALVSFLAEVAKPKTIAILYESSAFGTSGADAMENDAKKIGIQVVLKEKYEAGAPDFKPILSKVKSLSPDVDLHGLLRHGRLPADEADQGAAPRREALRRRRRRLRDPRVHRQRQGRRGVRRQRDALDARRSSTRAPRSSPRSTRRSTATTPPTTAPRPTRRSSCSRPR